METQLDKSDLPVIRLRSSGYFVAPFLLTLTAWFALGPRLSEVPSAPTPVFEEAALENGPRRQYVASEPPTVQLNEFERTCMECHKTFSNPDPRVTKLDQHRHIKLRHGINTHCYDCHDFEDRNRLALKDGQKVPFTRVVEVCAQCHGPVYRGWKEGLHGKRLGYWDESLGTREPIPCVGCHDPHWPSRPAMQGMKPLPGPHTLRMGEPAAHHTNGSDPLLRAIHGSGERHE